MIEYAKALHAKIKRKGLTILSDNETPTGHVFYLDNGVHVHVSIRNRIYLQGKMTFRDDTGALLGLAGYSKKAIAPVSKEIDTYTNGVRQGVQLCIDHIQKKLHKVIQSGGGNDVKVMLKILIDELNQYS